MSDERKIKVALLQTACPTHFAPDDGDEDEVTYELAAYRLATYIFDNYDMGADLARLKATLPLDLYVLALEKYVNQDHDT